MARFRSAVQRAILLQTGNNAPLADALAALAEASEGAAIGSAYVLKTDAAPTSSLTAVPLATTAAIIVQSGAKLKITVSHALLLDLSAGGANTGPITIGITSAFNGGAAAVIDEFDSMTVIVPAVSAVPTFHVFETAPLTGGSYVIALTWRVGDVQNVASNSVTSLVSFTVDQVL